MYFPSSICPYIWTYVHSSEQSIHYKTALVKRLGASGNGPYLLNNKGRCPLFIPIHSNYSFLFILIKGAVPYSLFLFPIHSIHTNNKGRCPLFILRIIKPEILTLNAKEPFFPEIVECLNYLGVELFTGHLVYFYFRGFSWKGLAVGPV